jgi:SAM-dependent methyltransferase
MKPNLYTSKKSDYLKNNSTWHAEDSSWKAEQIFKMIILNELGPINIVEIGCGAGGILVQLQLLLKNQNNTYEGYDISPDAFELSKGKSNPSLRFHNEDLLTKENVFFDLCLIIDVFEHVDNYINFIDQCGRKATYKIYHIPLDIHVSALLRNNLIEARNLTGHIHYFTKETALTTLADSGQEILDYFYTPGAIELPGASLKTKIANLLRRLLFKISPDLTVRLIGGYSLMVLTK